MPMNSLNDKSLNKRQRYLKGGKGANILKFVLSIENNNLNNSGIF